MSRSEQRLREWAYANAFTLAFIFLMFLITWLVLVFAIR